MTAAVDVVREPARAQALLDPRRIELLENLGEPDSAAGLARKVGLPRQRVNYHLRELEAQRLIVLSEERVRGSVKERIYRRVAQSFSLSPEALGALGVRPEGFRDRFSAEYQIALANRAIRELDQLRDGARAAGKTLPTLAMDVTVRFASPESRAAFADELTAALAGLVEKYHDESSADGRAYRVHAAAYPKPKEPADES